MIEYLLSFLEAIGSPDSSIKGQGISAMLIANIPICIVGFVWVFTSKKQSSDLTRWRVWSVFWASLSGFYILNLFNWPNWAWWVPFTLLDISVLALFTGVIKDLKLSDKRYIFAVISIVLTARLVDIYHVYMDPNSLAYFHQTLAGISLILWGWIHRAEDPAQSMVILLYGLIQLPLKQLFDLFSIEVELTSDEYLAEAYLAYLLGKFVLIPATLSVIRAK